ncbi:MAG: hypothetical protein ABSE84_21300, partial [Isosphaeraceae bacterium]
MTYGFHRQGQSAEFPEKRKIALRPLDVSPYLPSLVSRTGSSGRVFRGLVNDPVLVPLNQPGSAEQRVEQVRPPVEQSGRGHLSGRKHLWEAAGKRVRLVGNLELAEGVVVLASRQPPKRNPEHGNEIFLSKHFLLDS